MVFLYNNERLIRFYSSCCKILNHWLHFEHRVGLNEGQPVEFLKVCYNDIGALSIFLVDEFCVRRIAYTMEIECFYF